MLFVDTNVFLYARQASDPAKQRLARAWIDRAWRERIGRTSTQVLSEFYVNATRKIDPPMKPAEAWDDVMALLSWSPIAIDRAAVEAAHEVESRFALSWWDALIVAAAQLQGCSILLSEDLQDGGVFGEVTVRSPFTLSVGEAAAAYRAGPVPASRHRGRGRPRKAVPA